MNEDAFARRFYADRSELESLRIQLTVERPTDGAAEQENYSLRPGELPPAADRVLRHGARGAADGAEPARRRIRLRRAAAAGAAADHLGAPEPAARARAALGRARHHRLRRRSRAVGAPGEDRDGDLPQQDDHVRLLHDGARRDRPAPGRPLPPAVPGRAVLPAGLRARARGDPRVPALADPRQGLLRDQGRARLPPARGLRPARLRAPRGLAARRAGGRRRGARSPSGSRGRSSATSAATGRSASSQATSDVDAGAEGMDAEESAGAPVRRSRGSRPARATSCSPPATPARARSSRGCSVWA